MQWNTILVFAVLAESADVAGILSTDSTDSVSPLLCLLDGLAMGNELGWITTNSSISSLELISGDG